MLRQLASGRRKQRSLHASYRPNIAPGDQHMRGVVFTFVDADHHEKRWTSSCSSKPGVFKFARKK